MTNEINVFLAECIWTRKYIPQIAAVLYSKVDRRRKKGTFEEIENVNYILEMLWLIHRLFYKKKPYNRLVNKTKRSIN